MIREALSRANGEAPHCWPYAKAIETTRAVYLIRQFCHMTMYDRLSARPFLSECERSWMAFQTLLATRDAHAVGVSHGDIKCENVLVTSWGWCFLSDFASYKPSEIPIDNPSEFTYFFDSGGRRRCCIAPERFSNESRNRSSDTMLDETPTKVDPSADIFALGCTLAELFMDGKALFDLSVALQYRRGEYDPREALEAGVKDPLAREMITSMVSLDPSARLSARAYLEKYERSSLFPSYFALVHEFSAKFLNLDANGKIDAVAAESDQLLDAILRVESGVEAIQHAATVEEALEMAKTLRLKCPGVHLIAAHVCSAIRGATLVSARIRALKLLRKLSAIATDECLLQLMLPFCASSLHDPAASVRTEAVRAIADILSAVDDVPQSEFGLFREYIWPTVSHAASDPEALVRIALGEVLAELARLSVEFLQRAVASSGNCGSPVSFDDEIFVIRNTVRSTILTLLTPETRSSSTFIAEQALLEALLANSVQLAIFFGRDDTNDFLMPLLITCLNSQSPQLRSAFFRHISGVGRLVGRGSCELVLVPCIDRCLLDVQDSVISWALRCMIKLIGPDEFAGEKQTDVKCLGKRAILGIANSAAPLICHPSASVRNSALDFFAAAVRSLGVVDAFASLTPIVEPFVDKSEPNRSKLLRVVPEYLNQPEVLAMCAYPPPSRSAFEAAIALASGLRTAAVYAAASARIDRPLNAENQDPGNNLPTFNLRDAEMEAPSLKVMAPYIKALANARRTRSTPSSPAPMALDGAARQSPRVKSSRPPSIIEEGEMTSDSEVSDAWTTVFGAKAPLVVPQDARAISMRGDVDSKGATVVSASVVDTLSAAVKNMGVNRFKPVGAPEAETNAMANAIDDSWTPRGVLVAHLIEHRGTVTSIAVDRAEVFFVTGSEDGSCKIWDSRRIEKDVSFKSRLTYASQGGKITCVASTSDSHIVSGSDNGAVHVWRVEYTSRDSVKQQGGRPVPDKYTGAAEIRHVNKSEGAICALACLGEQVLCYVTQTGGVHGWDFRAPRDAFRIPLNPKLGIASALALDAQGASSWLVVGTSSGSMNLLDMRFQTIVQEWSHPSRGVGIDAMAVAPPPARQSSAGVVSRPLVWCAAGHDEVALWDVADGGCLRILRTLRGQGAALDAAARAPPSAMDSNGRLRATRSHGAHAYASALGTSSAYGNFSEDLRADELVSTTARPPGVRALLTLQNGSIVSGSTDSCIRVWQPGDASKSRIVSGKVTGPRPKFSEKSFNGMVLQQEIPVPSKPAAQTSAAHERHDSHRDAVVALAVISGSSGKMLISASRDMSVKLWK